MQAAGAGPPLLTVVQLLAAPAAGQLQQAAVTAVRRQVLQARLAGWHTWRLHPGRHTACTGELGMGLGGDEPLQAAMLGVLLDAACKNAHSFRGLCSSGGWPDVAIICPDAFTRHLKTA